MVPALPCPCLLEEWSGGCGFGDGISGKGPVPVNEESWQRNLEAEKVADALLLLIPQKYYYGLHGNE